MGHGVLIVDDHADFRRRTRQLLEVSGYQVVGESDDGAAGLAAARNLDPELVLLDVHLPDALGFELVGRFGGVESEPQVILISTHDEDAYRSRARESGARGFITKDELSGESIEQLLGR
jgi:DNA-binding NarL/FixJ family response regulator